jgi:hypothetical protein
MRKKLLVSTATLAAGIAMWSIPTLAQTSGCMPTNCPGANQPSTSGQTTERIQRSLSDQKSNAGQRGTTMQPANQAPPKNDRARRGKAPLPQSRAD